MKKLAQKVAFITGGSRGIGAGIARRLAREGAIVVITYSKSAGKATEVVNDIRESGGEALAILADSQHPADLQAAIQTTAEKYGKIDILVSNAGVFLLGSIDNLSIADYEATMSVNVRAVFVASNSVLPHMGAGGRIIIIGSNMADHVDMSAASLYAMSKSALTGLTKGMARDLGPKHITVNLVQPGPIDTDMNPADSPSADEARSAMAIGHYGTPEDVAGLVAYLASEESRFMTGTALTIDGGYNI